MAGRPAEATWNAICLADFGDGGVAFIAQPNSAAKRELVIKPAVVHHLAKIGFEKYFLAKIRRGESERFYEKLALELMGVKKTKA